MLFMSNQLSDQDRSRMQSRTEQLERILEAQQDRMFINGASNGSINADDYRTITMQDTASNFFCRDNIYQAYDHAYSNSDGSINRIYRKDYDFERLIKWIDHLIRDPGALEKYIIEHCPYHRESDQFKIWELGFREAIFKFERLTEENEYYDTIKKAMDVQKDFQQKQQAVFNDAPVEDESEGFEIEGVEDVNNESQSEGEENGEH